MGGGGGNFNNYFEEFFNTMKDSNLYINIGSPEHNFWKYSAVKGFFGYSTAKNDPNLAVQGKQLYEIFHEVSYFENGTLHMREPNPLNVPKGCLTAIPYTNEIPIDIFMQEGFDKCEVTEEAKNISNKIRKNDPEIAHVVYDPYVFRERYKYPEAVYSDIYNPESISNREIFGGANTCQHAPDCRAENVRNLFSVIETLESFSAMASSSAGELYHKVDIRNNVILKEGYNFIAEDMLNHDFYMDEDLLHSRTENIKITAILFKAQQIRELLYADIPEAGIPHYTAEEFARMCTDAALNLSHAVYKNDLNSEIFYEILCLDNDKRITNNFAYDNPFGLNDPELPKSRSKKYLSYGSEKFLYECEVFRDLENYCNIHFKGDKLNNINYQLARARHVILHNYLSDIFQRELFTMLPKLHKWRYVIDDDIFR